MPIRAWKTCLLKNCETWKPYKFCWHALFSLIYRKTSGHCQNTGASNLRPILHHSTYWAKVEPPLCFARHCIASIRCMQSRRPKLPDHSTPFFIYFWKVYWHWKKLGSVDDCMLCWVTYWSSVLISVCMQPFVFNHDQLTHSLLMVQTTFPCE